MMKNCELALSAIAGAGHADRAALEGTVRELRFEVRQVRPAHARRGDSSPPALAELHVAGLGHEAVDHPVEDDVVVGAALGERR